MTHPSTSYRSRAGISIVEILITVVLLGVGALAALGLQVSALRASGTAESIQTLTRVAESELQFRRGIERGGAGLADAGACRVFVPDGMTCAVVVTPCALVAGALDCATVTAASATAHEVAVTATSARGQTVALETLVATVASAATTGATEPEPEPEPEPDPAPDPTPPPGNGGGSGGGSGGGDPVACVPRGKSGKCK